MHGELSTGGKLGQNCNVLHHICSAMMAKRPLVPHHHRVSMMKAAVGLGHQHWWWAAGSSTLVLL